MALSIRSTASAQTLQRIKDVTPEIAAQVRKIWRTEHTRQVARDEINTLIGTHGVEYLGIHKRSGEHVYYCNAGDTYATTIILIGPRMVVGCWGDMVERNAIKEPVQL